MLEPARVEQRLVFEIEQRRQPRLLVCQHFVGALAQHIEYLLAARNIYVALLASRPACNFR